MTAADFLADVIGLRALAGEAQAELRRVVGPAQATRIRSHV